MLLSAETINQLKAQSEYIEIDPETLEVKEEIQVKDTIVTERKHEKEQNEQPKFEDY